MTVAAVPPVLGAVGFSGTGIAASSLAAKMMSLSAIANGGGVAAGSLVATLQSVGKCHGRRTTGIATQSSFSFPALSSVRVLAGDVEEGGKDYPGDKPPPWVQPTSLTDRDDISWNGIP